MVSSIDHDTSTSSSDSITPPMVIAVRRGLRLIERSTRRHDAGRREAKGTTRSSRLTRPPVAGTTPRIASAGEVRAAVRAGAQAASPPVIAPKAMPITGVIGWKATAVTGSSRKPTYNLVSSRASHSPSSIPGIAPPRPATNPNPSSWRATSRREAPWARSIPISGRSRCTWRDSRV